MADLEPSCVEGRLSARKHQLAGKMSAPYARLFCASVFCVVLCARAAADSRAADLTPERDQDHLKRIELFDGVSLKIPDDANSTDQLFSFEIDTERSLEEGRGRKGSKGGGTKNKKLLQRILPMFIMPFLIQSTIVPFFLSMLKFMLFKSMLVGKLALALILLNAFKNSNKS
ncbi:hypothetical protein NE865_04598 [Phthorimaea operculella]|nr:hypothetical protein NE865_04598 [Phthorimaea operculella]